MSGGGGGGGFDKERLGRVQGWMDGLVKEGKLPCAAVSILKDGKEAYSHLCGYQDVENKVPLAKDTLFRIYSMTKAVTCVAVMTLYEQGLFELTDPISKFIPCFKNMKVAVGGEYPNFELEEASSPITIQQLLTHTSGLSYWSVPQARERSREVERGREREVEREKGRGQK